jgi:hypothetical protein
MCVVVEHQHTMSLAITTYCTKNYCFALKKQIPRTIAALRYAGGYEGAMFIMAGDNSEEVKKHFMLYEDSLKSLGIKCLHLVVEGLSDNRNADHQKSSNISIALMQSAAWAKARELGASELWSLESDILPESNVLRVMRGVVAMDDWYDVVMCTYPNDGFLGGFGTPQNWIAPNVYPEERVVDEKMKARLDARTERQKKLHELKQQPSKKDIDSWKKLDADFNALPAKGNVFALNAQRWRPRGWLEHMYPGIGLGSIMPTFWVGMGCTYMSKKALEIANFEGYNGDGTQDLFLCWRVWHPKSIRMAVSTHAICSHVKRRRNGNKVETYMLHARHELGGEMHGHLRVNKVPFNQV